MIIYLMIGAPGAGKSTYVANNFKTIPVLSCDDIREEMFGFHRSLEIRNVVYEKILSHIKDYVERKENFVIDSTYFNEIDKRNELYKIVMPESIHIVYVNTPITLCIEQNKARPEHRFIKQNMIEYLFNKIDPPNKTEGFSFITHIPEVI